MTFKAKMYLVGGVDDFEFTLSTEFASMKATVDAEKGVRQGQSGS
jgi:3-oxoacyl-(acyl-carrier-protein) synthase